jgi:Ca-activated chloride channel family protein
MAKEDFNHDQVDAGEIGAGHTVTALYEVVPVGVAIPGETLAADGLKFQKTEQGTGTEAGATATSPSKERSGVAASPGEQPEMLTVKIRYKEPAGDVSGKMEFALRDAGARFEDASQDFKFAAAVAGFGMELRHSPYKGTLTLQDVVAWGRDGLGRDAGGDRHEFLGLVEKAEHLVQ